MPDQPPLVAALIYDGLSTFEYGCAAEIFGLPRPEYEAPLYRFSTCALERRPLRANGGITVQAEHGLELLNEAHTIIIPGWRDFTAAPSQELVAVLQAAYGRGARIASICSGAFLLAHAGLLRNRRATTHWCHAAIFRELFPSIQLQEDVLYIDEGRVLTSAGSAAGLDMCLHLVRRDYGPKIANDVARRLVIAPHRDGGQAQFVRQPVAPEDRTGRLAPLLDRLRADLTRPYSVADLASIAGVSKRSLLRRFREATGTTPHDWLIRERIRCAQDLLESTDIAIESIAYGSGFGSPESLRFHFRRISKTTPALYRKRFGGKYSRGCD